MSMMVIMTNRMEPNTVRDVQPTASRDWRQPWLQNRLAEIRLPGM